MFARRFIALLSGVILVGTLMAFGSPAQAATGSGHITGTVTDTNGDPISGINVGVFKHQILDHEEYWTYIAEAKSATNGSYDISGLPTNSDYRVLFDDLSPTYVSEFWGGGEYAEEGDPVSVTSPNTTANIDIQLERPAHITGRLTKAGGVSAGPDIPVTVNRLVDADGDEYWTEDGVTNTVVGGYFDATGFGSGTYRLGFAEGDGSFVTEYWDNVADLDSAHDIAVAPESTVAGKDAELTLKTPNVTTTSKIFVNGDGTSKINMACVKACTGSFQIYSDLTGTKRSSTVTYSIPSHSFKTFNLTKVPLDATTGAKVHVNQFSPRSGTTQYDDLEIARAPGNALKTTAKVTVDPYGKATVNVSCTKACSGYAQVWGDGTDTGPKSNVFHYTLTKAGFTAMPMTGVAYVNTTSAKVRLAISTPVAFPGDSPQFNPIELVKGPQNVVKTSASTHVSATGKATVNVSCTMACEGYVQLWSDEAGTKKSANVFHYKLAKAGFTAMAFTGVPHINSSTWKARIAATQPATGASTTFNSLQLIAD